MHLIRLLQLVGEPCTRHGPYTFYRAFRSTGGGAAGGGGGGGRVVGIGDFFFCRVWEGVPEVLSVGQLQLLWHDKNQQQPLASLRLYFLPENTPDGRNEEHGEVTIIFIKRLPPNAKGPGGRKPRCTYFPSTRRTLKKNCFFPHRENICFCTFFPFFII